MAPKSVATRLAESYLAQLLEDDHLPELVTAGGQAIPTGAIVERLIHVGATSVVRKRTREHGEVIVLTFQLEPSA